jgi:uncharacterized protein YneF (UPF0154 family)
VGDPVGGTGMMVGFCVGFILGDFVGSNVISKALHFVPP